MKAALRNGLVLMVISASLFSCVPAKRLEELSEQQKACEENRQALAAANQKLETENTELRSELEARNKQLAALESDTSLVGSSLRKMSKQYAQINKLNDELLKKRADQQAQSEEANRRLVSELQDTQERLQLKEDALIQLERELNAKKANLDNLNTELQRREQRVAELEGIIARKDSAASALKTRISDALLGFRDKGLSVEQRNGKIYVSMAAKLLFASGSTKVDPEGKKALLELSKAVKDQQDIGIVVEGHTDTDKIRGGAIKDNWDLSVMRATAVVRIMTEEGGLSTDILTAAGRGEFQPLDPSDNAEAKARNR
ncbi:MAG: OmpA family protein, partial [Bacteroidota bacterium]